MLEGICPKQARDLADKALASFIIIQAALKRSRRLHRYTLREDLNRRMPGFSVRIPFKIRLTCLGHRLCT